MRYLCVDLETGSKESYKRKGNPLTKENKIVAIGLKPQNQDVLSDYVLNDNDLLEGILGLWLDIEDNYHSILVGHNIKFDLLHLWKYEALQEWLNNGGRIWDTQLAHYMLTGQQEKYPALRDIAVRCYGCKEREKKMEAYWDKGIDTEDIPKELVLEDVRNDVFDTEQVMLKQVKLLKEQGMYKLVYNLMDSVLATTEMEYNGIFIDKEVLTSNKNSIQLRLEKLKKDANLICTKYWR